MNVKKFWDKLFTVITFFLVVVALLLVVAKLSGGGVYTILSGSMEPNYHVGSLIYVKPVDYHDLKKGDVITFALSKDMSATHRIISISVDEKDPDIYWFKTKGDANDSVDANLVNCKNIIGKPIFTIAYLGYFTSFLQTKKGMYVALVSIVLLCIYSFLPTLINRKDQ